MRNLGRPLRLGCSLSLIKVAGNGLGIVIELSWKLFSIPLAPLNLSERKDEVVGSLLPLACFLLSLHERNVEEKRISINPGLLESGLETMFSGGVSFNHWL